MTDLSFILQEVSERTGISIEDIKGHSRRREYVFARYAFIYIARRATKSSYVQIGQFLDGRDHATIIHAYQTMEDRFDLAFEARKIMWIKGVADTFKTLNERTKPTTLIGREIMRAHDYFMANDYDHCIRALKSVIGALEPNLEIESLAVDQKMFEEVTR